MRDTTSCPIRILIADDHGMVRFGLRGYMATMPGLDVVGEAASGEEVLCFLEAHEVDIILMDLVMPGMSGAEATRVLAERYPNVRVIILTSFLDSAHVLPAIRSGAAGYLLKDILPTELAEAIHAVHHGQSVLHPKVVSQIAANLTEERNSELDLIKTLSERELAVLQLLTRGLQNHEIAVSLCVSENTVRTHVSNILTKLELRDRTQAALFGVRFLEHISRTP
jgi:DNA-binding NarL/FixJ family response regulator